MKAKQITNSLFPNTLIVTKAISKKTRTIKAVRAGASNFYNPQAGFSKELSENLARELSVQPYHKLDTKEIAELNAKDYSEDALDYKRLLAIKKCKQYYMVDNFLRKMLHSAKRYKLTAKQIDAVIKTATAIEEYEKSIAKEV